MRATVTSFLILAIMLAPLSLTASMSDAVDISDEDRLLLDYGNGSILWMDAVPGETILDTVVKTLDGVSIPIEISYDDVCVKSVDGISQVSMGDMTCSWRFYIWNTYSWDYGDTYGGYAYQGGTLALAFYPSESLVPAATPFFPEVWTAYNGSSVSDRNSTNTAPDSIATPLEWYIEGSNGGVYSALLFADGLLYYVAGGDMYGSGTERNPCVFCLDTVNHELAWAQTYPNDVGYETTTPVLIGDLLIVTSSNGHIYAFDRMSGEVVAELVPEGDSAHFASRFATTYYTFKSVYDSSHNWMLEGHSFITGPATSVYDSGALYFNTYDGQIRSYSVDRENGFEELWCYSPTDDSDRGCFYHSPPVIAMVDDRRVVLSGSYSGRMYCVDAVTGEEVWVSKLMDLGGRYPGSVSGITLCPDGTALVGGSDGEMTTSIGCVMLIDLTDGSIVWSLDSHGSMTVVGNIAYGYLTPSVGVDAFMYDKFGDSESAVAGFYAIDVETGRYIWKNPSADVTKSGLTFCDGLLYCVDYSPGTEWPNGGAVRCIDPDTGQFVWSVKLDPYNGLCYSMSSPTIVDGKIYVTNDEGYVYCLSMVPGKTVDGTSGIDYRSVGFAHWSWIALFASCIIVALVSVAIYRK